MRTLIRPLAALLVLILATMSVGFVSPKVARNRVGLTDEELLLGIAYGIGPVAKALGTDVVLLGLHQANAQEYEYHARTAAQVFMSRHQDELTSIFSDIRSGDVFRTEVGLSSLTELLVSHYEAEMQKHGVTLGDEELVLPTACGPTACVAGVVLIFVYSIGSVWTTGIVIAAGIAIVGAVEITVTMGDDNRNAQAAKEALVLDIVKLSKP